MTDEDRIPCGAMSRPSVFITGANGFIGRSLGAHFAENGYEGATVAKLEHTIGLSRGDVYIANVIKCRPPGNRNPEPAELAQCEPFLIRQIALVQPRIILAMGRFAVQSLLRSTEPIGRLRGRVHQYQGVPLVVTYHPAYLLRSPGEKRKSWEDLKLALKALSDGHRA